MKLLLDTEGKVNFNKINRNTTVNEVLDAVDMFLRENPLHCNKCDESCCKKSWSVEMDNICVNRLNNWEDEAALVYVKNKLIKKKNYYRDFNQLVLNKDMYCNFISEDNLCSIYEMRPVICRLYICCPKSYRYNVLRELIGSTFLKALVYEDNIRKHNYSDRSISSYKKNPAVFSKDYNISLNEIFNYAEEEGWLDSDERDELYMEISL